MKLTLLTDSIRRESRLFGPGYDTLTCLVEHTEKVFGQQVTSVHDLGEFYEIASWDLDVLFMRAFKTTDGLADALEGISKPPA